MMTKDDLQQLCAICHRIATKGIGGSGMSWDQETVARYGAALLKYCLEKGVYPEHLEKNIPR